MTATSLLTGELSLSEQKAELWKDIPGYEGLYEASTMGRVRTVEGKVTSSAHSSHRVWKQRIMKEKVCTNRYGRRDARVCLWKDGKVKTYLVARLVAMTWCTGYSQDFTVNHINGNPLDNRAGNLEWCTLAENIRDGYKTGLFDSLMISTVLKDMETGEEHHFSSRVQASLFLGRNKGYIYNCIVRHRVATDVGGRKYAIC